MLALSQTTKLKRDIKLMQKRNADMRAFKFVVESLASEIPLPEKFRDHALIGDWQGFRECHITPDWLLIYRIDAGVLILHRTGTHSDLFR